MPGVNVSNPLRQKTAPVSHSSHPIHQEDNGLTASMFACQAGACNDVNGPGSMLGSDNQSLGRDIE